MQLPTAVCAASVLYSRSAGESEGPLPCGQGGGAPTSLTGVWRLDPGHFLCVGQMSEVYLLLKKAAHVYFSGYFTPLRPPSQGCSVSRLTGLDCSKGWLSMLARAGCWLGRGGAGIATSYRVLPMGGAQSHLILP